MLLRKTLGVIIGRFQVDELHDGHQYLINEVISRHNETMVILGEGPLPTTCRNPLPVETRKALIKALYPDVHVVAVKDHPDDGVWSRRVDIAIGTYLSELGSEFYTGKTKLYCSRDGFADYYSGQLATEVIEAADLGESATLHRDLLGQRAGTTRDFAHGVIWANQNKFPTVYSVVDMAILKDNSAEYGNERVSDELLVITKDHLSGYIFPGGFCDVGSPSSEHDASREVTEETGLVVDPNHWKYLRSMQITDDWRYRSEADEMRTTLFFTHRFEGELAAGDDAATAEFVAIDELSVDDFNRTHRPLAETVLDYVANHFG